MTRILTTLTLLICTVFGLTAQDAPTPKPDPVLGTYTYTDLLASTDAPWIEERSAAYQPTSDILDQIKPALADLDEIVIYYGSWCGDSKREMPKMIKTLQEAGYAMDKVKFVGVESFGDRYKKSPDGAADGQCIYRVPTFTFIKDGSEVARMIEQPKLSIERDLLALLTTEEYTSAYPVLARLTKLDRAGILDDPNVIGANLEMELGPFARKPNVLNGVGYVLAAEGRTDAAIKIMYANITLFPDYANGYDSIAEILAGESRYQIAAAYQKKALQADPNGEGYEKRYFDYLAKAAVD